MLLFKSILDFKRDAMAKLRDKRKAKRYAAGPGFPLKATLNLTGLDKPADRNSAPAGSGLDWSGPLANLSSSGVSLQLPPAAITGRGEKSLLRLRIEDHLLEIPCVVAHFRTSASVSICGLSLQFPSFDMQKGYLQLLEAVIIGATLASGKKGTALREEYRAENNKARLTAWREKDTREIDSFELVIGDCCLRGKSPWPTVDVYVRRKGAKSAKTALSVSGYFLSNDTHAEVRQLYRWIVPNLTKTVPTDLRKLMQRLGSTKSDWRPPTSPT